MRFVDPEGKDWYTINDEGAIRFYKKRENETYDRLFLNVEFGPLDLTRSLIINDKSILSDRCDLNDIPSSVSKRDMMNIFYFVSDAYMDREWGLYQSDSRFSLITSGSREHVVSPFEKVIWKIHSHSDTPSDDKMELESMGYWPYYLSDFKDGKLINKNAKWSDAPIIPNDLYNLKHSGIPSMVYFPMSGHVYQLKKQSLPAIVERRK